MKILCKLQEDDFPIFLPPLAPELFDDLEGEQMSGVSYNNEIEYF